MCTSRGSGGDEARTAMCGGGHGGSLCMTPATRRATGAGTDPGACAAGGRETSQWTRHPWRSESCASMYPRPLPVSRDAGTACAAAARSAAWQGAGSARQAAGWTRPPGGRGSPRAAVGACSKDVAISGINSHYDRSVWSSSMFPFFPPTTAVWQSCDRGVTFTSMRRMAF